MAEANVSTNKAAIARLNKLEGRFFAWEGSFAAERDPETEPTQTLEEMGLADDITSPDYNAT